jgi:hypothetical protein
VSTRCSRPSTSQAMVWTMSGARPWARCCCHHGAPGPRLSSCAGQLRLNLSFIIVSDIALSLHLLFSSSSLSLEGSSDNKQNHQLENKIILSSTSRYPRSQHASHRHDVFAGVFNCHCEYVLDSAQTLCSGTARFECWKELVLGLTLRTPDSESESKRIIVWQYMCIQREREREILARSTGRRPRITYHVIRRQ